MKTHLLKLLLLTLALGCGLLRPHRAAAQDLFPPTGGVWRYLADGSDQGTAWRMPAFNDSGWSVGVAKLGFGGDDEVTTIGNAANAYTTFYFRVGFTVADASAIQSLVARMIVDDGVVVYLNGVEAFRRNMPAGPVNFSTLASVTVGGADETNFVTNAISPSLLVNGANFLAAEVHQVATSSSDLGFDLGLTGATNAAPLSVALTGVTPTTGPPGANVTATATVQNGQGQVDFYLDGQFVFQDTVSPFTMTYGDLTAGAHTLAAVAYGFSGARATSAPVTVTITNETGFSYLVPNGAVWKYLDNGSDQGTAWQAPGFNDSGWASGPAELGFGDITDNPPRPERTVINGGPATNRFVTTYFRHTFNVADPSAFSALVVRLLRDDGGVVYLNGVEVFRSNLGTSNNPVVHTNLALNAVDDGTNYFSSTNLSPALLVVGPNVLAVEIHQTTFTSSDGSFDAMLLAQPASLLRKVYRGIPGTFVTDLTSHPKFINDQPDEVTYVSSFEDTTPSDTNLINEYFGVQLSGYLTAPVTGNYDFYIASDNEGMLFLSTDETPAHKVMIAREPEWNVQRDWLGLDRRDTNAPQNRSTTLFPGGIPLVAGRQYYIEALSKEHDGGNHVSVTWHVPGEPAVTNGTPPIPGVGTFVNLAGTRTNLSAVPPSCVPPPKDMVFWTPLDEPAGPNALNSPGGNSGTHVGPGVTPGKVGNAILGGYVAVPTYPAIEFSNGDFSFDAWIKPNGKGTILSKFDGATMRGYNFYLDLVVGNPPPIIIYYPLFVRLGNGINSSSILLGSVQQGVWSHVTVTVQRGVLNGVIGYINGQAGSYTGTAPAGSYATTQPVWVGNDPAGFSGYFNGAIDEVELFNRKLEPAEVQSIHAAGSLGKCKHYCHVPWDVAFCSNAVSVNVTAYICNSTTQVQQYKYWFQGLPPMPNPFCDINGPVPTDFTPQSSQASPLQTGLIQPGKCVTVNVNIARPSQMLVNAQVACYKMFIQPVGSTDIFSCLGSVQDARDGCAIFPCPGLWAGIGPRAFEATNLIPVNLGPVAFTNTSGRNLAVRYQFVVMTPEMTMDDADVSLNGLPPGTPVTNTLVLAPGQGVAIPLTAQFARYQPGRFYTVLLQGDTDGDGQWEPLASASLRNIVPPTPSAPPVFTVQPQSLSVTQGQSAAFNAVASGNPAPTYQWKKNGADIPGATSSTLVIPLASSGDAGDYTVAASNSVGSALSSVARLAVIPLCERLFADDTFLNSDWSLTVFSCPSDTSASASQIASGGCPPDSGPYRRIVNTLNTTTLSYLGVVGIHLRNGATHNPSIDGSLNSVDYSECNILFSGAGAGHATGPALKQGNNYYIVSLAKQGTTPQPGWATFSLNGLVASDFDLLDCTQPFAGYRDSTQHPNFCTGSNIEFGFFRGLSSPGPGMGSSRIGGIDTWRLQLHCGCSNVCVVSIDCRDLHDIDITTDICTNCVVVNYPTPPASGTCPPVTVVCTPPSGICFPVGATVVTCKATDVQGNMDTCTFTVNVVVDPLPKTTRVWNTGMGGPSGNVPLAPATADPNFTLVSFPVGGCTGPAQVVDPAGFPPPGLWLPNSPESQWIGPAQFVASCPAGVYRYQLKFYLPCLPGASIVGRFAADNSAGLYLNGVHQVNSPGFSAWTPVNITSGFVAGSSANAPNVVDIWVTNAAQWTGLRTELTNCFSACCGCVSPPPNMVLWAPLDETAYGSVFNGSAPIPGQHVCAVTAGVPGEVGNAVTFPGLNNGTFNHVAVPHYPAIDFPTGNFSFDAWVKPSGPVQRVYTIVSKFDRVTQRGYTFYLYPTFNGTTFDYTVGYRLGSASGIASFDGNLGCIVPPGVWSHIAVTVDRTVANGVICYVNGQPGSIPQPAPPGNYGNSSPLWVGQDPASVPTPSSGPVFMDMRGEIDEVEVFGRALRQVEVEALYVAGHQGKCKHHCHVPWDSPFCLTANSINVTAYICNSTPVSQMYNYWFQGQPIGPGCSVAGPTSFTSLPPSPVTVPAGGCVPVTVTIVRPVGMAPGSKLVGCYKMFIQPVGSSQVFSCLGSVQDTAEVCPTWCPGPFWSPNGPTAVFATNLSPVNLGPVALTNTSGSNLTVRYQFVVMTPEMTRDTSDVSLNGLPPGTPVTNTMMLAPDQGATIELTAQFVGYQPGRFYTVLLQWDPNGDGNLAPLASATLVDVIPPDGTIFLNATLSGTNIVLSWPVPATGFILEETAELRGTNTVWNPVTNAPVHVGPNKTVTLPISRRNDFYRLKQ